VVLTSNLQLCFPFSFSFGFTMVYGHLLTSIVICALHTNPGSGPTVTPSPWPSIYPVLNTISSVVDFMTTSDFVGPSNRHRVTRVCQGFPLDLRVDFRSLSFNEQYKKWRLGPFPAFGTRGSIGTRSVLFRKPRLNILSKRVLIHNLAASWQL